MQTGKTVLLIDDDEDDLQMLQEALHLIDGNYEILRAKDGIEGLKTLQLLVEAKRLPCLVVLDINMPKLDGKQTFLAISANNKMCGIPVVVFSTSSSPLDKAFFEQHQVPYFIKPVDMNGFAATASSMIEACHQRMSGNS